MPRSGGGGGGGGQEKVLLPSNNKCGIKLCGGNRLKSLVLWVHFPSVIVVLHANEWGGPNGK